MKKILFLSPLLMVAFNAHATATNTGLFDDILGRYAAVARTWAGVISGHAEWLFWVLVLISMVWTFGFMAVKQADLSEFFAEFIRFTIFTGFFFWLLTNGPNYAMGIIDSMRTMAGNAMGTGSALKPSGIVDIGFAIFNQVVDTTSIWDPVDAAVGIIMSVVILVVLALIGVNMLLLLISGWILAYAGIFFLGFGGSKWTSDIALNYYKTVLGVAIQLFAMTLLVGIGTTFVDSYYLSMSNDVISITEMGVMLVSSVILLVLTNQVPSLLSGIITGASVGAQGIGNFGAGAAVGAAGMAAAAVATGGSAFASGATSAAGSGNAIVSAIKNAAQNVSNGTDILSGFSGGSESSGGESSGSPMGKAMGFATNVARGTVDAGANLAGSAFNVGKEKAQDTLSEFNERVSETTGGKMAKAIQEASENKNEGAGD